MVEVARRVAGHVLGQHVVMEDPVVVGVAGRRVGEYVALEGEVREPGVGALGHLAGALDARGVVEDHRDGAEGGGVVGLALYGDGVAENGGRDHAGGLDAVGQGVRDHDHGHAVVHEDGGGVGRALAGVVRDHGLEDDLAVEGVGDGGDSDGIAARGVGRQVRLDQGAVLAQDVHRHGLDGEVVARRARHREVPAEVRVPRGGGDGHLGRAHVYLAAESHRGLAGRQPEKGEKGQCRQLELGITHGTPCSFAQKRGVDFYPQIIQYLISQNIFNPKNFCNLLFV